MSLNDIVYGCRNLNDLLYKFKLYNISIFDFKIFLDESNEPLPINVILDCEPYLSCILNYAIDEATFDGITYKNTIRILSLRPNND